MSNTEPPSLVGAIIGASIFCFLVFLILKMLYEFVKWIISCINGPENQIFYPTMQPRIMYESAFIGNQRNLLRNCRIEVVDNVKQCRAMMQILRSHCDELNVLGFDCEWVPPNGNYRPTIDLLQLASHRGFCVLIRLCKLQMIPKELKDILEDKNIMKVGNAPQTDAIYLFHDYDVRVANTLDLRYLAELAGCEPMSLKKMAEWYLNDEDYEKGWVFHMDWNAIELNDEQIEYAAKDAIIGIQLVKFFARKLVPSKLLFDSVLQVIQHCFNNYVDLYYNVKINGQSVPLKFERAKRGILKCDGKCYDIPYIISCTACYSSMRHQKYFPFVLLGNASVRFLCFRCYEKSNMRDWPIYSDFCEEYDDPFLSKNRTISTIKMPFAKTMKLRELDENKPFKDRREDMRQIWIELQPHLEYARETLDEIVDSILVSSPDRRPPISELQM